MANVTYDIMWREGMLELLDQLEEENPDDSSLAPKTLQDWCWIYIKYVKTFKKLEVSYDYISHPQKRIDIKKALEACIGRLLEVRNWMIFLSKGREITHIDDLLVDFKQIPENLEITIPRYFVEDREKINERARQGREKFKLVKSIKKQRQYEDKRRQMGMPMTQLSAVLTLQAAYKGYKQRQKIKKEMQDELVFLGMEPKPVNPDDNPIEKEQQNLQRRKVVQFQNLQEYDEALVNLKQKVQDTEGQEMREAIQDKINGWFISNRNPETGQYPEYPSKEQGGSLDILRPMPKLEMPQQENISPKGTGKKGGKTEEKKPKEGKKDPKKDKGKVEEIKSNEPKNITTTFLPEIESAIQTYVTKWQERDESNNFFQRYDPELVKDELRPVIFEEIREQVDEEMRILFQNLKDLIEAEKYAKTGKKPKKKKAKKGGKKDKSKKKKDPTADRSIESLYAELVSNGIIQPLNSPNELQEYIGQSSYLAASLEKINIAQDPSIAQTRSAVAEFCILPMGSQFLHERVPYNKSVLLYGLPQTGKSLLTNIIVNTLGAVFFNLSPRNTDGKYTGKQVQMLMHMVFKVAKIMAPSIIYIDETEKVFISDKKKLKEYKSQEPFNRIKKEFLKEIKQLTPEDRVLILGNSSEPYLCVKKDESAFISFWNKKIYTPLPDYASRQVLWRSLFEKYGAKITKSLDLLSLAQISQNFTAGAINLCVKNLLTEGRKEYLQDRPLESREVINWLCKLDPVKEDDDKTLRAWMAKLQPRDAPVETVKAPQKDDKKAAKKK